MCAACAMSAPAGPKSAADESRRSRMFGERALRTNTAPIELLVENVEYFKTCKLDYHEGEKYPQLERDLTKPDLLTQILKSLAPKQ